MYRWPADHTFFPILSEELPVFLPISLIIRANTSRPMLLGTKRKKKLALLSEGFRYKEGEFSVNYSANFSCMDLL